MEELIFKLRAWPCTKAPGYALQAVSAAAQERERASECRGYREWQGSPAEMSTLRVFCQSFACGCGVKGVGAQNGRLEPGLSREREGTPGGPRGCLA